MGVDVCAVLPPIFQQNFLFVLPNHHRNAKLGKERRGKMSYVNIVIT